MMLGLLPVVEQGAHPAPLRQPRRTITNAPVNALRPEAATITPVSTLSCRALLTASRMADTRRVLLPRVGYCRPDVPPTHRVRAASFWEAA